MKTCSGVLPEPPVGTGTGNVPPDAQTSTGDVSQPTSTTVPPETTGSTEPHGQDGKSVGHTTPPPIDEPPMDTPSNEASVDDISQDLSSNEENLDGDTKETVVADMQPRASLDLSKFSDEQINVLQDALNAMGTRPSHAKAKVKRPTFIEVRMIDEKLIVDFGNAYKKSTFDEEEQKQVIRQYIKVRLEGDDATREIPYREFNNAERLVCELVGTESKEEIVEKGEVFSAEYKVMVPMIITYLHQIFTLRLPDGRQIKINKDLVH